MIYLHRVTRSVVDLCFSEQLRKPNGSHHSNSEGMLMIKYNTHTHTVGLRAEIPHFKGKLHQPNE